MKKKAQVDLLITILLILLAIATIITIWMVIKGLLEREGEISEIKVQLFSENFEIENVNLDELFITMAIRKGGGKVILVNKTKIEIMKEIPVDVMSVIDLSGSMQYDLQESTCWANPDSECCLSNGCSNEEGCTACQGIWSEEGCYLENVGGSVCTNSKDICRNICNGLWDNRLNLAKRANVEFINNLLEGEGNRIGIVGYESSVRNEYPHPLSNDNNLLINHINSLSPPIDGGTCICCGINKVVEYFETSGKPKVMVLMSDGAANIGCPVQGTESPKNDAILAAEQINQNHGIIIHSIGFGEEGGVEVDQETLMSIAQEGKGNYYYSDVSELNIIYQQIVEQIKADYKEPRILNYLKIMFYSATSSWEHKIYNIPKQLETKNYEIYLVDSEGNPYITDVTKITVNPVILTSWGEEVIGPTTDVWELEEQESFFSLIRKWFNKYN